MFSKYQKFVIAVLAFLQFTIILDFMIMSPLGAMMMPSLHISPKQFGIVVSVYAFSAGLSGILAAGFADRYDRKKFLMFFYSGFLLGTLFCAIAPTYELLVLARMFTGIFGGVIGSIVFAMITDLFHYEQRGRVMGFIQTAFAASQVLGIPIGLYIATHWGWHMPFLMIVAVGLLVGLVIFFKLQPVKEHLKYKQEGNAFQHMWNTASNKEYLFAFTATMLLSMGGYMMMPFSTAYQVNNLKIPVESLTFIYLMTGVCSIFTGPIVGKISDQIGKLKTFVFGTLLASIMSVIYVNLPPTTIWIVTLVNAIMFVGIFSRMIPTQAVISAIPEPKYRGSFMAINASMQQMAGGAGSLVAGLIVYQQSETSPLERFDWVGYLVVVFSLITWVMMTKIHKRVHQKDLNVINS